MHAVTEQQALDVVMGELAAGRGGWVVTPNLDYLRRLVRDPAFARLYGRASLRLADGMPLVWAARLSRTPLPGRVAGSDLLSSLSRAAADERRSVFLLGGAPGTAERAAAVLRRRHPALRIAGTACPTVGDGDAQDLGALAERLRAARPDIVFVALGSPKQDRVIDALRAGLPSTWWLGVGISFSFLSGDIRRAPGWMQRCGLEWLHRLAQEPRRLARRYLLDGLPFAATLLARAWLARRPAPDPR